MWRKLAATGLCAAALALPVRAEVNVVNMSKQFGLPYLAMMVIEAQQLIEKNAKAMGLGDVKTTWTQRAGPATELDALLAGQADFIGPGVPTLATIWDKTSGTPQEARALIAMQSMPYVLVTRNPNVKTIADFTDKDKIALPAVKLTGHAIALEIEAAKIWGPNHYDKLDSITITRSHADAAAAVMSGQSEINAHPRDAAQIYLAATKDKNSLDALGKMVADPDVDYTTTPVSIMKIVDFMYRVGRIKKKPESWKDMFFPEAYALA